MGHDAYLVGGGVRDLLLHRRPKDFDIATNASPEVVRQIFRNSRLIGRRFRLVHVYFRNEIIEVSTFRANAEESFKEQHLNDTKGKRPAALLQDNTYGTIEEDAWRRDFTINALYYNIADSTVIDYTGGMSDLRHRLVRIIGDPTQRFHEDPVRLLRAIRMAAKLGLSIEVSTQEPLLRLQSLLRHVASSRLFDEAMKLFFEGYAFSTYELLVKTGYFQALFPDVAEQIINQQKKKYQQLIELAMRATDERFASRKSLNPGFLLSILLWPLVQESLNKHVKQYGKFFPALHYGINVTLDKQLMNLMIPRRLTNMMRSIWILQYHLEKRRPTRIDRIYFQRYFRAAFDFLVLRAKSGDPIQASVDWWREFQEQDDAVARENMIQRLR